MVADVFDALTADRPYRAALPVAKAIEIIRQTAGQHHEPDRGNRHHRHRGRNVTEQGALQPGKRRDDRTGTGGILRKGSGRHCQQGNGEKAGQAMHEFQFGFRE